MKNLNGRILRVLNMILQGLWLFRNKTEIQPDSLDILGRRCALWKQGRRAATGEKQPGE